MIHKKNIILLDNEVPDDWEFLQAIEKVTGEKWELGKKVSNENFGSTLQKLIRYGKYFTFPMKIAVSNKKYKKILAWQQFYGLILAFYLRLFHVKNAPKIYIVSFIYKSKKSIIGKVYKRFMNYIVNSGYITGYIVHSENEKQLYSQEFNIPESEFSVVILGDEDRTSRIPPQNNGKYFLAAGRSNRDYSFLLNAWKKRPELLKIICDTLTKTSASNIEILTNCYEDDYFRQLAACYAVIVPLEDTEISSGQLVIIQSMMYGKPIIITDNKSIYMYVKADKTGLIIDKSEKGLVAAIDKLRDPHFYNQIAINQRTEYDAKFSLFALGEAIGMIIK